MSGGGMGRRGREKKGGGVRGVMGDFKNGF